jgi:dephospho-CoA kinase
MSREAAASRMAAQASREERLAAADFIVVNNGTRADLDRESERVWRELVVRRDSRIR